ncbi:MAG: exo-alpha-sialidase [Pirellulales bacterium]|nr:exo-alpha-sialidase [Pirellulales bacterium]
MKVTRRFHVRAIVGIVLVGLLSMAAVAGDTSRPIRVLNPDKLPASLPADRIAMGTAYKPSMAMLPNGELVMVALMLAESGQPYHEWAKLWRSSDNGQTWSAPVRVERTPGQDLIGREHWLTSIDDGTPSGTLFSTCTILGADTSCPSGFQSHPPAYINRSTDGGRTWTQTQIGPGGFNSANPYTRINRNVLQMPDGQLTLGVGTYGVPGRENYLWTSTDKGLTWQQSEQLSLGAYTDWQGVEREYNSAAFMDETYLYRNKAGELVAYSRLDRGSPLFPMDASPPYGNDGIDRMLMSKSTDGGMTWTGFVDCGGYAQHYARVTRLTDDRLLMTFTQRAVDEPLGLRALVSYDDGRTWDFDGDHLILDENTPSGWAQGGGFGNTIQLADGSLISCYSYHDAAHGQGNYQVEVVRWSLPPVPEPSTGALLGVGALCLGLFGWWKLFYTSWIL